MFKKLVIGLLAILDVLALTFAIQKRPSANGVSDNKKTIVANQSKEKHAKHLTETITVKKYANKVNKDIQQNDIDLNKTKNDLSGRLTKGFTMAYNDTHTQPDMVRNEDQLPNLVGKELADQIEELGNPTISQAGKVPAFDKLNKLTIAYGDYNVDSRDLEVMVYVDYSNPKEYLQKQDQDNTEKLRKHGVYTFNYNAKTNVVSDVNYQDLQGGLNTNEK